MKLRSITGMNRSVVCCSCAQDAGNESIGATAAAATANDGKRASSAARRSCSSGHAIGPAPGNGGLVLAEFARNRLSGRDPKVGAGFRVGEKLPQQAKPHRTAAALWMQDRGDQRAQSLVSSSSSFQIESTCSFGKIGRGLNRADSPCIQSS